RAQRLLDERQQRARALDRRAHLRQVALVLGPWRQAGPPAAKLEQRRDRLQHDVVGADALELLLVLRVGRLQLLLRRLRRLVALLAHRTCTSSCPGRAYVSRVSATLAANASRSVAPSSSSARWRWAPLASGSTTSIPSSARIGALHSSSASIAARVGTSAARARSIILPSRP